MGFYLRLESGVAWKELKTFDLELLRFVPSQGRVYLDTSERLRREPSNTIWLDETPSGETTLALFRVNFRNGERNVLAAAQYIDAAGATLQLKGNPAIRIVVVHSEQGVHQCTVSCPVSGESRTGPHACIECRKGDSAIEICC